MPYNPFMNPRFKDQTPYWLKEWDEKIGKQHLELMRALERKEKILSK